MGTVIDGTARHTEQYALAVYGYTRMGSIDYLPLLPIRDMRPWRPKIAPYLQLADLTIQRLHVHGLLRLGPSPLEGRSRVFHQLPTPGVDHG